MPLTVSVKEPSIPPGGRGSRKRFRLFHLPVRCRALMGFHPEGGQAWSGIDRRGMGTGCPELGHERRALVRSPPPRHATGALSRPRRGRAHDTAFPEDPLRATVDQTGKWRPVG